MSKPLLPTKKSDEKTNWSDQGDIYKEDRCHHLAKSCAYLSVIVLLLTLLGVAIYIAVNVTSPSAATSTANEAAQPNSYLSKIKLGKDPVPEENEKTQAQDLNPAGRIVPPVKNPPPPPLPPKAQKPQCDPVQSWSPAQVHIVGTIPSYISPDGSDGSFNMFTLNITMKITSNFPDPSKLVLNVNEPYTSNWPQLNGLVRTWVTKPGPSGSKIYRLTVSSSGTGVLPGLYAPLNLSVSVIRTPTADLASTCPPSLVGSFNVTTDVTCSATILDNWCDGERRWIPKMYSPFVDLRSLKKLKRLKVKN